MAGKTIKNRITALEKQTEQTPGDLLAVLDVCDLTPEDAQRRIDTRREQLERSGFAGTLIVLDK